MRWWSAAQFRSAQLQVVPKGSSGRNGVVREMWRRFGPSGRCGDVCVVALFLFRCGLRNGWPGLRGARRDSHLEGLRGPPARGPARKQGGAATRCPRHQAPIGRPARGRRMRESRRPDARGETQHTQAAASPRGRFCAGSGCTVHTQRGWGHSSPVPPQGCRFNHLRRTNKARSLLSPAAAV